MFFNILGKTYSFLINLSGYPEYIFYGLSVIGLIYIQYTRPNLNRPIKSPLIGNIFFILSCLLLAIMPFVPPNQEQSIPYFLVPLSGCLLILFFYGVWVIWGIFGRDQFLEKSNINSKEDINDFPLSQIDGQEV